MHSLAADPLPLRHAVALFERDLLAACTAESSAVQDAAAAARLLKRCQTLLARFGQEATAAQARGLQQACEWMQANLDLVGKQGRPLQKAEWNALQRWPDAVAAYLATGGQRAQVEGLLELVDGAWWPFRPSDVGRRRLADALAQIASLEAHAVPEASASEPMQANALTTLAAASAPAPPADASIDDLRIAIEALMQASGTGVRRAGDIEQYGMALEPVVDAAAAASRRDLFEAALHVASNLMALRKQPALVEATALLLLDFPIAMLDCAKHPSDRSSADVLLACLGDATWPQPLAGEVLGRLRLLQAQHMDAARNGMEAPPALLHALPPVLQPVLQPATPTADEAAFSDAAALAAPAAPAAQATQAAQAAEPTAMESAFIDLVPLHDGADETQAAADAMESVFSDLAPLVEASHPPPEAFAEPSTLSAPSADAASAQAMPPLPADMQECDPENLQLLATEFNAFAQTLKGELECADPACDAAQRQPVMASCAEMLERFATVSQAVGMTALHWVFSFVARRVAGSVETGLAPAQRQWMSTWSQSVRSYLAAPTDPSAASALAEVLADPQWPDALDAMAMVDLESVLPALSIVRHAGIDQRPTTANADDMSLALPADVHAELFDSLLLELPVQSAEFAGAVQRIASGHGATADLEIAKRAAHTLKGAANTVGVRGIANLTHHLEDILIALTHQGAMPPQALCSLMSRAADCLEEMSEAVRGDGQTPAEAVPVYQAVLDWANRIDAAADTAFAEAELGAEVGTGTGTGTGTGAPVDTAMAPALQLPQPAAAAEPQRSEQAVAAGETSPTLRVAASVVDELLRLVGETMIANTQIKEQLRLSIDHTRAVTRHNRQLQRLTGELEQLVDIRGITTPLNAARRDTAATTPGSGPQEVFDALEFEHYNELQTVTRHLTEAATDSRELSAASEERLGALADLLETQSRLHLDNQGAVMKTRMVTISTIEARLQRSVRQTSRLLDKQVELHLHGGQTSIDSHILNELVDPLMHVLRNAVDHGIETADVRARSGKPVSGRIDLHFGREGASILVRCVDDGAGLDHARILAKAQQLHLVAAGATPSEDELARVILVAGFSTRDAATQVSGRGIGMDAVNERIQGMKGALRLASSKGRGMTVEIRLPVSLMTTNGLLIKVGKQTMAVSSYGVQDIHYVTQDRVERIGNGLVYHHGDAVHPLDDIHRLLGRPADDERGRDWFPALLVRTDDGSLRAVRVQDVLDSQELVVKDLGSFVAKPRGVIGVTILGDGSIAPVLDLSQLLRAPGVATAQLLPSMAPAVSAAPARAEARKIALVVDDSMSARRAAAQFMKDAGFDVRSAMDGIEAAAMVEQQRPDIALVDMEMPRMNGLELTSHLRSREATRDLPIIMITSRSTDKHRKQAQAAGVDVYLTKPFNDDELRHHIERLTSAVPTP